MVRPEMPLEPVQSVRLLAGLSVQPPPVKFKVASTGSAAPAFWMCAMAPFEPAGPCGPVEPVAPVAPVAPCGPAGPWGPCVPVMVCGVQALLVLFQASDCPLVGAVVAIDRPWILVAVFAPVAPVTSPERVGEPDWSVQVLVAVQAYQFAPADAALLKKACPTTQVAGNVVPTANGLVEAAPLKSTSLVCVLTSNCVCAAAQVRNAAERKAHRYRIV